MKNKTYFLFFLACIFMQVYAASSYREKYEGVLHHYRQNKGDSLKYKAALFLIDNMEGHTSPEGLGIQCYTEKVYTFQHVNGIRELMQAWNQASKLGPTVMVPDSVLVDHEYLIQNIDDAFDNWRNSPWNSEIDFKQFCRYILPFQAKDERLCKGWRRVLKERYEGLVMGVTDMKKAFALVHDSIMNSIKLANSYCPYTLDVLVCDHIKKADCDQRCDLLASVLRALSIPAAIDVIPMWADYSMRGHTWISLVMGNGDTYTVFENDKEAKRFNKIDASQLRRDYKIPQEDHCPYEVKTEKKPVKVYRMQYQKIREVKGREPLFLKSPFSEDVSKYYGLNATVRIKAVDGTPAYLCAYLSSVDWVPVAKANPENGYVTFKNVGSDIVCTAISMSAGKAKPISVPFLVGKDGIERHFTADTTVSRQITIDRKYPLCSYMTDKWGFMLGGVFEGSHDMGFYHSDTLAVVKTMPYGMTDYIVENHDKFRYVRYKAESRDSISLSELSFHTRNHSGKDSILSGSVIFEGVDSAKANNVFDHDLGTDAYACQTGYWIGLDLGDGNSQSVSKITFAPISDSNNIEIGHLYELYYFDTSWKRIARKLATERILTFEHVPVGALLLLKDKTKGREERIFEYENGKQVWH